MYLPLRSPEDRGGAGQGEADPERDVGGGGAAERPGGAAGGAEASGEGGGQGPGGCYALQRLRPELGLARLATVAPVGDPVNHSQQRMYDCGRRRRSGTPRGLREASTPPALKAVLVNHVAVFTLSVHGRRGNHSHSFIIPASKQLLGGLGSAGNWVLFRAESLLSEGKR